MIYFTGRKMIHIDVGYISWQPTKVDQWQKDTKDKEATLI